MIESLADIEALAIRCHSEQSREYISEAIRCYRASAYRAAIVSTWIAIVFDLIDKIRELSVSGDVAAKTLETKYENYIAQIEQNNVQGIKSALEFEREILETCRDQLQFFDPQQFIDLIRIREDRHRCAHPSFQKVGIPYYPSAEQARVHIRNAVVFVLAQPPVQGKAALAQLKTLVGSEYFPNDTNKAKAQLENSGLKNATEALVRGFIDQLVFCFLTEGDLLFFKNQVLSAINATFDLFPAVVEDRLSKQLNKAIRDVPDKNFRGVAILVAFVIDASSILEHPSIDKIFKFIEEGPSKEVLDLLEPMSRIKHFLPAVQRRIDALTFEELTEAINTFEVGALTKERALQFLSQARSWDRANDVLSKAVLPLLSFLSVEDIERVVRMPTETGADLLGAHGYRLFVDNVRKAAVIDETELNDLLIENRAEYLVPQRQRQ